MNKLRRIAKSTSVERTNRLGEVVESILKMTQLTAGNRQRQRTQNSTVVCRDWGGGRETEKYQEKADKRTEVNLSVGNSASATADSFHHFLPSFILPHPLFPSPFFPLPFLHTHTADPLDSLIQHTSRYDRNDPERFGHFQLSSPGA